jgi:predicted dehydrogenase
VGSPGTIGVGLAGYGLAGRLFHSPYIRVVKGMRIVAIATSHPERQSQARADHPEATVVASLDQLLAHPDVDIVVVVTPNRAHVPVGIRALDAGRHVVVDKPIAMDIPEAETLIDAAHRAGRVLSVYQNRRWDGDFQTVRRLLDDRRLGVIDSLEARFERRSPVGVEWRETTEEAGGPHRDLGSHLVDQSLLLFGPVERVFAQFDRRRPGSRVEDSTFVALDHTGGIRSRLWTSLIADPIGPRFRVRGLGGDYIKDSRDPQEVQLLDGLRPDDAGFGDEPPDRWGRLYAADGSVTSIPAQRGDYRRFYELFRAAVRGEGPPPVDPADSVRGLRVLEAAERSARSGRVETPSEA